MFTNRTSIHGRRMAISTTGGFVTASGSTGSQNSTALDSAAQMWGQGMTKTVSANGGTIENVGVTIISTDSTSGAAFVMQAPVVGAHKEIHFGTSATALSMNTTATTIFFNSTLAEGLSRGSTTLSIAGTAAGIGGSMTMRGLSASVWGIVTNSVGASS